jgi:nucleoside 2-deoxyribosyltransferase
VPEGWTATEPGYFGSLQDGRDTLTALQTYRQTSERWKAAYSDLRTEFLTTTEDIKKQMAALEGQLNNERKAWKAEIVRSRTNNLLWIVLAGGIGYVAGR